MDKMIIKEKVIVKNYKCFDASGGGFEMIYPINVIIGKNNSGKTSLIDLVQFLVQKNSKFISTGRDNTNSEVLISHKLSEQDIAIGFRRDISGGGIPGINHFEYGKKFSDKICTYKFAKNKNSFQTLEIPFENIDRPYLDKLPTNFTSPLVNKTFCNITAERDIISESSTHNLDLQPNGTGATTFIETILNVVNKDSRLIEINLLKELNAIIKPDIEFTRILVQTISSNMWEIYFEDKLKKRIALSKMGSGIKTVLLVLLNLIIRPVIENTTKDKYVFAFEELENNLHPSLQRRLYEYIKNYSEKHSTYFFITTHSNIVIDTFGTYEYAQMIHIINDGDKSTTSTILSASDTKEVLKDLDIRASDLLQCNGVIWVEGPSDKIYLKKWLEVLSPELKEGLHFIIMFYGGRLLSNLSFDLNWLNKEFIPLLKINTNAFVVIDRDGKRMTAKLNETKKRINQEIGDEQCWITKGREIENYLSNDTISNWLSKKHGYACTFNNNKNEKIENNIQNADGRIKLKYNSNKRIYSTEIVEYIKKNSLDILDLKEKLNQLIKNIREWNSL